MGEIDKPFAEIEIGNETYPLTRNNLRLYRHIGAHAMYDHCYVHAPDGSKGAYIFQDHPDFETYAEMAEEHQAPIFLNVPQPSENDIRYYIEHALTDLNGAETIPAEWLES